MIAFLNTAFYSYNENVFCGNRCYLFCTSILHDIKREAWTKKKGKKNQRSGKKRKKKKIRQCVSFHFSETNLCMPIRVEHFDIVLHTFKCSLFLFFFRKRPRWVLVHRPKENKLFDFLTSQQNEYFVDKSSEHPRRDTNKKKETLEQNLKTILLLAERACIKNVSVAA